LNEVYNTGMFRAAAPMLVLGLSSIVSIAAAQTPVPFPKPGETQRPPAQTPPANPRVQPPQPGAATAAKPGEPNEASLGLPIYPGAEYVTSYDAGRGQRYYLFGTNTTFADVVGFYRTSLKQRGELVYEEPPIHMFEVGRFREETMAFPPGVTVKDYTWGGSLGYLNPKRGAEPARFKTIIQLVPQPGTPAEIRR
jgi:hypothetical protein